MGKTKMRYAWDIILDGKRYACFWIDGKEHTAEDKDLWIYRSAVYPDGYLPPVDSEDFIPYKKFLRRICWKIELEDFNSSKEKYGEVQYRHNTSVNLYANDLLVYSEGCGDMNYAMAKVQMLMVELGEHSYNFFAPEREKGRKVYFHGMPATIIPREGGNIAIKPDYTAGLTKEEWWAEFDRRRYPVGLNKDTDEIDIFEEDHMSDEINWGSAVEDRYIVWHRS